MTELNDPPQSAIGTAVRAAAIEATPGSYAQRYGYSLDEGGKVVAKDPQAQPKCLSRVRFNENAAGELEAYVPSLASGRVAMDVGMYGPEWNPEQFANWAEAYNPTDGKQDIRRAIRWWRRDPLVYKCVKVLSQLANARMTIKCDNEDFQKLVTKWRDQAMPHSFRKAWFHEFYRTSMVPTIKTLIPYKPRDYKPGKAPQTNNGNIDAPMERATGTQEATEAVLKRNAEAFREFTAAFAAFERATEMHKQGLCSEARLKKLLAIAATVQYKWLEGNIAGAYSILDPLDIEIRGPHDLAWLRQPFLWVTGELRMAVDAPTDAQREMLSKLPLDLVRQIKEGETRIWLSPNICTVVCGEKQPYERYPTPIACHAEEALEMKYMLTGMDKATARNVRDRILKVTIGNDEYPAFDEEQIRAVAAVFNNPTRNLTIFWNHTLKIEWCEPQNTSLSDAEKYTHWNNEIRTAFGISAPFTGTSEGKGGGAGDGVINLKGLKEEIVEGQDMFLEWFLGEVELLKKALGVKYEVEAEFDRLNLEDAATFIALLLQLYQAGLIDPETALETMNFHFPSVEKRMANAIKLRKKGLFMPVPSANNLGPDGMILPSTKGGTVGPKGGAPKNQPKEANKNKVGKSQPKKAVAKLLAGETNARGYLVVELDGGEALDAEDRALLAEKFAVPTDWIVSQAEYTQATGHKVSWLAPLPALNTADTWAVITQAQAAMKAIGEEVEQEVERIKAAHPAAPGKRGKYVTDKVLADLTERATASAIGKLKPEGVTSEEWAERRHLVTAEYQASPIPQAGTDLGVLGAVALAAQYQKRGV